jgi:hypothetical protein
MTTTRWTLVAALAAAAWLTCNAFSQDQGQADGQAKGDAMTAGTGTMTDDALQKGMQRWQECTSPGPMHKHLERFLGSWNIESHALGLGGPAKETGTAEWRWLFEGRFIQQTWKGEVMGMPAGGQITIGYDNFKQKFVASDVNTLQTALLTSEGNFDASGNTLITWGFTDSPMTGECDRLAKYVWRFEGPDKFTFELHDPSAGDGQTLALDVVYTRRR